MLADVYVYDAKTDGTSVVKREVALRNDLLTIDLFADMQIAIKVQVLRELIGDAVDLDDGR